MHSRSLGKLAASCWRLQRGFSHTAQSVSPAPLFFPGSRLFSSAASSSGYGKGKRNSLSSAVLASEEEFARIHRAYVGRKTSAGTKGGRRNRVFRKRNVYALYDTVKKVLGPESVEHLDKFNTRVATTIDFRHNLSEEYTQSDEQSSAKKTYANPWLPESTTLQMSESKSTESDIEAEARTIDSGVSVEELDKSGKSQGGETHKSKSDASKTVQSFESFSDVSSVSKADASDGDGGKKYPLETKRPTHSAEQPFKPRKPPQKPVASLTSDANDPNVIESRTAAGLRGVTATSGVQQTSPRANMNREEELEPWSWGGIFVVLVGAVVFAKMYKTDQKQHTGIRHGVSSGKEQSAVRAFVVKWSPFHREMQAIEALIEARKTRPLRLVSDEWNVFRVTLDHLKHALIPGSYNSESLYSKWFRLFNIPSSKLLPSMKQKEYGGRTLVIDIASICHSTWAREKGVERAIRPFYTELMQKAAMSGWEVVLFGSNVDDMEYMESPEAMGKLDSKGFVQHYLWAKDAYYFNGHRCKDLRRLNRSLSRVLVVDSDTRNVQMQPRNAVIVSPWTPPGGGEPDTDRQLQSLVHFLDYIMKADVADIPELLDSYRGEGHIGEEFQRRFTEHIASRRRLHGQVEGQDADEEYDDDEEEYDEE